MEIASPLLIGWLLLAVHSSGGFAASGLAQLRDYTEARNEPLHQTQSEDCSAFGVNSGSPHMVSELGTVTAIVGDIVVFRCQSEPGSHHCNSSDRHFAINGSVIDDGVIRMDANVAVLHLCLSAETNGTYIDCNCQNGNATTKLDMVYVVAAKRQTAESTNITCLIDGGESSMSCHWDYVYNGYPPQLDVNWTATYFIEGAEDDFHGSCVMAHPRRTTSCTITDVQIMNVYLLNVTGVSALGEIHLTSRFSVRPEIVKLPPIRVNRVSTTSTSIEMELQPPISEPGSYLSFLFAKEGFECEAMVYDGLSGTAIKDELFTLNATLLSSFPEVNGEPAPFVVNITGLLPFQLHRVRLRCRIARVGQFWSESVYESAETKEAAPSVGPAVFKTSGYSPSKRQCTNGWYGYNIYWQGIRQARGSSNGLVAYYTVQLHTDDDNKHSLPRSTSLARVGPHERQAWICLRGDTRHIVTVHAATGAGVGPAAGALVIPPRSKVVELAVKPCRIFVRRGNDTDVRVFLTAAFNSTGVGDVAAGTAKERKEEKKHGEEEEAAEKGEGDDSKDSSFWTVAWCQQADENCKDDIEHRRAAAGSVSLEVKVNGSALHYAFGVAQTIDGQSGGITWAECSHDSLAGPSEMDRPEATVKRDGVRVSIKRSYCSSYATPEEPRVLLYCPVQAKQTKSDCNDLTDSKESATKLNISNCCQGQVMRRVLDSCENSVILPLVDDETTNYIVWLSYDSAVWSHLSSSAVLATWAEGGNWTVEIICTVVVCAAVAGSILIVIAYRKLRPNMKLGKIYRVPPLREMHGASTTLFEEGTEKSKEYFPMMHWQARVNWAPNGTGLREQTQHSPSFSEESGDSGLSSVKSRGPAQAADDREATAESRGGAKSEEQWRRGSGLLPSSSSSFSAEDYDDAVEVRDLVSCGSGCRPAVMKPGFRNAGYQPDAAVDAYFRTLPSVNEKEAANDLCEPACDIELAKSPKLVAAKMLITSCSIDSAHRKTDQLECHQTDRAADSSGRQEDDRATNVPARSAAQQPSVGSSDTCNKTCNRSHECSCASRSGALSSSSASPECRQRVIAVVSGVPPPLTDDYCYAGDKSQISSANPLDDLSDSAGSSSSCYVKCATHDDDGYDDAVIDYDDDDAGDEPAVVDISQFF